MTPTVALTALTALAGGNVPDLPAPVLACAIQRLHPTRKPADVALYAETHLRLARAHGLDPLLLAALAAHESDHRWQVLGPACEVGIYQVLPRSRPTGACMASAEVRRLRADRGRLAADVAAAKLARMRDRPHPLRPWWAAHNWGYRSHTGHRCRHAGYPARVEAEYRRIVKEVRRCTTRPWETTDQTGRRP